MNRITDPRRGRLPRVRESGIAAVEFALALPVLVLLFFGMAEITSLLVIAERVDRVSYSVADIVAQMETNAKADLDTVLLAPKDLMSPYNFLTHGVVIISSVYKDPTTNATTIKWQYTGGGGLARTSKLGLAGHTPSLPAGLTLNSKDNVIVAEAYYAYTPMFSGMGILSAEDLYHASYYKTRLTTLLNPPS